MTGAPAPAAAPARPGRAATWLLAIRPATLPAAGAGVAVGVGAALATGDGPRLDTALACLLVALLLQVVANLANDLSDFRRGADTEARQGPLRVAAAGLLSERTLERGIAATIVLAAIAGGYLAWVGGPHLLAIGGLAILAALAYTGGPVPYGYRALGELFVLVFFGFVAVAGTAYLQGLVLRPLHVAAALPPGLLVTAILVVNNLRDIPTDAAAGKRTLAVLLGRRRTQLEYLLLLAAAYAIPAGLAVARIAGLAGVDPAADPAGRPARAGLALLLPLLTLPDARRLAARVRTFREPRELNPVLRATAALSLRHGLLFALGLALSGWPAGGPG